jgi:hypothetical protein
VALEPLAADEMIIEYIGEYIRYVYALFVSLNPLSL